MSKELTAICKYRIDAEDAFRDNVVGIELLRGWLRSLHIDVVIGRGTVQGMTQDEIAERLGEYPRNNPREFKLRDK